MEELKKLLKDLESVDVEREYPYLSDELYAITDIKRDSAQHMLDVVKQVIQWKIETKSQCN